MSTYTLRRVPDGLIARAKHRAREDDTSLDAILIRYLHTYAEHGSPQSSGGHARKLSMTADERSESAKRAATARWKNRPPTDPT